LGISAEIVGNQIGLPPPESVQGDTSNDEQAKKQERSCVRNVNFNTAPVALEVSEVEIAVKSLKPIRLGLD
jgi:hypothetical protein